MQKNSFDNGGYPPSEDTFFIASYIENETGKSALDVGSGSGYLTKLLSENFCFVVGTDINFNALRNQTFSTQNIICCNGSDPINFKFDLIVCNLPYLATDEILDVATDGGFEGFEIPKKIFDSVIKNLRKDGKFIFVTSSLSNYHKLLDYSKQLGLSPKIVAKKKLFFEELILIESTKN